MEFLKIKNSKYISKIKNFQEFFTTCKRSVMCMTYKTKLQFNNKLQKISFKNLKQLAYFDMIENYDEFSR